jgi:serine/threonine protein kinase
MPLTVENLCGLLIRSQLQPAQEVKACYQLWQQEARQPGDASAFARWLVEKGYLTEYQATLLSHGYADNFFLGSYKILDRIGRGRLAGVYKVVHSTGQTLALAVLPPSRAADLQLVSRFHQEARKVLAWDHPTLVRTFQVGEANGLHYLVLEWLEGETLQKVLDDRGPLPPREALRIAYLICRGLEHLQHKGQIHGDLSPDNVLLCPAPAAGQSTWSSQVKVLPGGPLRALLESKRKTVAEPRHKSPSCTAGPEYLAPEMLRNPQQADIRADLFSVGCLLYHTLSGKPPPLPSSASAEKDPASASDPVLQVPGLPAVLAEEIQVVLGQLLARDPGRRYGTPGQAAEALQKLARGQIEEPRPASPSPELTRYLQSLQATSQGAEAARAEAGQPGTGRFPVPNPAGGKPGRPPPSVAAVSRRQRTGQTAVQAAKQVRSPPRAAALPAVNVELVEVPAQPPAPFGLPISRDVFMLSAGALLGAFSVLLVVFVVWLVMLLLADTAGGTAP